MAERPFYQEGLRLVAGFFIGFFALYLLSVSLLQQGGFTRAYAGLLGFGGGLAGLWLAWRDYVRRLRAKGV